MRILRRLFVVILANNSHGKSHLVNSLLSQGLGAHSPGKKGRRDLCSPWGRRIDALVFVRSFQETEKNKHSTILGALEAEDSGWSTRELVILPSHLNRDDIREMITAAHENGFDAVVASVLIGDAERENYNECWAEDWDERWNIPNPSNEEDWKAQVDALGHDLWTWICEAMQS